MILFDFLKSVDPMGNAGDSGGKNYDLAGKMP